MFWSARDLLEWFKRYIDDVLALFKGDLNQAKWFIQTLNSICPGRVEFTFEFSNKSIIFLNTRLILNRELKQIDVDYHVKPTNKQLFLHYRSCHPEHVFRSIVYNQALLGKTVCSYPEWCERHLQKLRVKFLQQEYPAQLIDEQFNKVRQLNRDVILYRKKDEVKRRIKAKTMRSCLVVTYNPANPPFHTWIKSHPTWRPRAQDSLQQNSCCHQTTPQCGQSSLKVQTLAWPNWPWPYTATSRLPPSACPEKLRLLCKDGGNDRQGQELKNWQRI